LKLLKRNKEFYDKILVIQKMTNYNINSKNMNLYTPKTLFKKNINDIMISTTGDKEHVSFNKMGPN